MPLDGGWVRRPQGWKEAGGTGKMWVLAFIVLYFGFHRNKMGEAEEEGLKWAHLNNFPGSGILGLSLVVWCLALV